MSIKIVSVDPAGLASRYDIQPGDRVLRINGHSINDQMDLEYYSSDYQLDVSIEAADGKKRRFTILRDSFLPLGLETDPKPVKRCHNHCVFCFIDQMPPGLRSSLYVKDDDYLYSRDYGNYITLTNLSEAEIKRVLTQHISPLYISVHTSSKDLRQRMMGYKQEFDLLRVLKRLSRAGIAFHTQIVCVPGYNDGEELNRTVEDLLHPSLATLSIGVVPVGLTRFRQGLPDLKPFDRLSASALLKQLDKLRELDRGDIIYAADEFYVLSGKRLPPPQYYQDYPQAENGIGLLSLLRQGFSKRRKAFITELDKHPASYLLLHSRAATQEITRIVTRLSASLDKSQLHNREIRNLFMGPHISVSGLLTAEDICRQHDSQPKQTLILPGSMFNDDGISLDGLSASELARKLARELLIVDPLFDGWHRV
ncbi:MAG: DUF512 domain-containing protein [Candidatus Cloacimonetes bacterium]|nr:DUF512 domain-containing protein [Candidatus Cloacimonadota bacterium]